MHIIIIILVPGKSSGKTSEEPCGRSKTAGRSKDKTSLGMSDLLPSTNMPVQLWFKLLLK